MDVDIRGDEQLARLYQRVKSTADGDLRKELLKGIRHAVKPLTAKIKNAAEDHLPGELGRQIKRASIVSRTRPTASSQPDVGVRVIGQKDRDQSKANRRGLKGLSKPSSRYMDIAAMDKGTIRHPLFGNRNHWYEQQVKPGFWTKTIDLQAESIERDLVQIMDEVAEKLTI